MKYIEVNKDLELSLEGVTFDGAALLTLNRPEKRNALSLKLMDELCQAIKDLEDAGSRVVVITANGPAFCSGLDLNEAIDPALIESTAAHVAKTLSILINTPLVTIAAVNGDAFAGGAGLIAACDLVVMAKTAVLGFPEVRRGLVAALVASVLARQIGGKHLSQLLITGEPVLAEQALRMGIVNEICDSSDVLSKAMRYGGKVLQGGPEAVRLTKRLILDLKDSSLSHEIQHALALHHAVRQSEEAVDGVAAFLEKQKPFWQQGQGY